MGHYLLQARNNRSLWCNWISGKKKFSTFRQRLAWRRSHETEKSGLKNSTIKKTKTTVKEEDKNAAAKQWKTGTNLRPFSPTLSPSFVHWNVCTPLLPSPLMMPTHRTDERPFCSLYSLYQKHRLSDGSFFQSQLSARKGESQSKFRCQFMTVSGRNWSEKLDWVHVHGLDRPSSWKKFPNGCAHDNKMEIPNAAYGTDCIFPPCIFNDHFHFHHSIQKIPEELRSQQHQPREIDERIFFPYSSPPTTPEKEGTRER